MKTAEEFWQKVDRDGDGCWPWLGGRSGRKHDRGILNWNGHPTLAYRVALIVSGVEIPKGMNVHHRCENPICVRPDHLEIVTPRAHGERHRWTHCQVGHPLSGRNLGVIADGRKNAGMRYCRMCDRLAARKRRCDETLRRAA